MENTLEQTGIEFLKIWRSAPDLYLLLTPELNIIDATDNYLKATLTERSMVVGRGLFEVFPDNPDDPDADGVSNLSASLHQVLEHKQPHCMDAQKYDIQKPDGSFEVRYWSPLNTPVLSGGNEICYIIHRVEDITEQVRLKADAEKQQREKLDLEEAEKIHIRNLEKSEDRFLKIFNLSPVSLYITDLENGRFLFVNQAFESLFHARAADIIGKTVIELGFTDEDSRKATIERIRMMGGRMVKLEIELTISTGEKRQMLLSTEIIEIDQQECFLVAMMDITERREIEQALSKTNRFLDTILENIPDMVFVKDAAELRFMRFNKAGEDILGYPRADLIGKNDYDFFSREQADFFTSNDREVLRERKLKVIEEEPIQTKYGERWLYTKKIPIFEDGKPVYMIGISEDITEKRQHLDAILRLNKELEAFSYSVSHDLRTPLRAINGYAEILEQDYGGILDAEGKRLIAVITRNAVKMGLLIDDLLRFSKLGKKELQKKDTDMRRVVDEAISEIARSAAHNAAITIDVKHRINSDESLMKLVMINLIGNAVKYSSNVGQPVIEVRSRTEQDQIIFSVKDNGAGFDMRYVGKLFGVFQRLHSVEEFDGTGVGLAIVHRIITRHGGSVWAEGQVNDGAIFYFSIPRT